MNQFQSVCNTYLVFLCAKMLESSPPPGGRGLGGGETSLCELPKAFFEKFPHIFILIQVYWFLVFSFVG